MLGQRDVRAGDDVERRLAPVDAILGEGVAGILRIPTHVPHLEEAVLRVVEDAVAEHHRGRIRSRVRALGILVVFLPARRRPQHRVRRMIFWPVEDALERGLLDEKVVHEQLTAKIDRDDIGTVDQVRRHDRRRLELAPSRRPRRRQPDAVVERVRRRRVRAARRERGRQRRSADRLQECASIHAPEGP
jgi:hypothetical protein